MELLKEKGVGDVVVFGGGIIPAEDVEYLRAIGVKGVFTPGATTGEIIRFVRENVPAAV
jgi:methylmalonyl-CoA mutase C-terminal domain/subunit